MCRAAEEGQLAPNVGCQPLLSQIGRRPANAAGPVKGLASCLCQRLRLIRSQQANRLGRHRHLSSQDDAVQRNLRLAPLAEPTPVNEGFIGLSGDSDCPNHLLLALLEIFRHGDVQRAPPINLLLEESGHACRQRAAPAKRYRHRQGLLRVGLDQFEHGFASLPCQRRSPAYARGGHARQKLLRPAREIRESGDTGLRSSLRVRNWWACGRWKRGCGLRITRRARAASDCSGCGHMS
jgi:hypothetical protein